tara:strand:+ start:343 stop:540 length:198 start_codon:yes stop_codon:yes gene_type:complete
MLLLVPCQVAPQEFKVRVMRLSMQLFAELLVHVVGKSLHAVPMKQECRIVLYAVITDVRLLSMAP